MKDLIQKTIIRPLEKILFNKASVITKEHINESYIYFELECDGLKNKTFHFGDYISISLETSKARSYTPIDYDSETGFLSFIYYCHGEGLGDSWMKKIRVGDQIKIFGPRKSMHFHKMNSPLVFIGDETSVGLAASLMRSHSKIAPNVEFIFEANSIEDTEKVLKRFGITAELYQAKEDEVSNIALPHTQEAPFSKESKVLITGNSDTVKYLREKIKNRLSNYVIGVPYWIPGRAWR